MSQQSPKLSNFQLTSLINQAAGNVPNGTDAQLRKQAGLIRDEVVELLGNVHMDALYRFDMKKIAQGLLDAYGWAFEYGRNTKEMDEAKQSAEAFLALLDQQEKIRKEQLPNSDMPEINTEAVRDDIQDILVTTYGLSYYLRFDADDDHLEVYRSNMSKFDPTMELAQQTQQKYRNLGVVTEIRPTTARIGGGENLFFYVNICAEDVTGTDGKFYPKGKFLKSINFEEPKYRPTPFTPEG